MTPRSFRSYCLIHTWNYIRVKEPRPDVKDEPNACNNTTKQNKELQGQEDGVGDHLENNQNDLDLHEQGGFIYLFVKAVGSRQWNCYKLV